MKRCLVFLAAVAVIALWAGLATAAEYHVSGSLFCADCHTMHFSMQHGFDGGAVGTTPQAGGNWLGTSGPNAFLLKAPGSVLCLSCHDGQSFAPDVMEANNGTFGTTNREAGGLNMDTGGTWSKWTGHSIGTADTPPGYDATLYTAITGGAAYSGTLECTSCHIQHGNTAAYRNLGWRKAWAPTYKIDASAPPTTEDVWVTIAKTWTTGSGPNNGGPGQPNYYDQSKVYFNRQTIAGGLPAGITSINNRLALVCTGCHGQFHSDATVANNWDTGESAFKRHPTNDTTVGAAGTGGMSSLTRFTNATQRVKVWATWTGDPTATPANTTNPSPGCVTCHKAHGNQNPFGLIFLARSGGTVDENGANYTLGDTTKGLRNLCGQCHGQGN